MQKAASDPQGQEVGGLRQQEAATRRQQPAIKARSTKQKASVAQESSTTDRSEGHAAASAEGGAGQGIPPVGAGSKAAALLRPRKSWRPTDMAEAAGSETGAT